GPKPRPSTEHLCGCAVERMVAEIGGEQAWPRAVLPQRDELLRIVRRVSSPAQPGPQRLAQPTDALLVTDAGGGPVEIMEFRASRGPRQIGKRLEGQPVDHLLGGVLEVSGTRQQADHRPNA